MILCFFGFVDNFGKCVVLFEFFFVIYEIFRSELICVCYYVVDDGSFCGCFFGVS